jgi:hypothetical protein
MARARNIKPSFFMNEELGIEDPLVSLLFISLWCLADRDGRLEDRPMKIKAQTFPYRDGTDINGYLTVLHRLGLIERYKVKGIGFIQVVNFKKHQSPHNTEKASDIPGPEKKDEENQSDIFTREITVKQRKSDGGNPPDSLIPDSLIPDSPKEDSPNPEKTNVPQQAAKPRVSEDVQNVFDCWRTVMNHPKAVFDDKRRKIIAARLKDGYSANDLCKAIRGCSKTPFYMGENDRGTKFDDIFNIMGDASKVDRFMRNYDNPPVPKGKQAQVEAINRAAADEFINGSTDIFAPSERVIDGEVVNG